MATTEAARAVEWYPALVLNRSDVDFSWYELKLGELAEKHADGATHVRMVPFMFCSTRGGMRRYF